MPAKKAKRARLAPAAESPAVVQEQPVEQQPAPQPEPAPRPMAKIKLLPSGGATLYIFGMVVAIIAGMWLRDGLDYWTYLVLAVLGFVVAFVNITEDEASLFLLATVTFIISTNSVRGILQAVPGVTGDVLVQVLANLIVFTAASAFIVSLKEIIKVARNK